MNLTTPSWSGERGEKWRSQLSGMEAMLRPVDAPVIDALQLTVPCTIAEVGCGGGGTTLEVLRRVPAGSLVHGFDLSPALIELARSRPHANDAIAFEVADIATATPRRPYDRLVSRFSLMFFDDPQTAFKNLLKWLAPAGRFAFAVWGPPENNPWLSSVTDVVARIIQLPPVDPDAPGPFRYADRDRLITLLDRAGFTDIEAFSWRSTLAIGGGLAPAAAADFAIAAFSSFAERLAAAGANALDAARQSLTTHFANHQIGGVVQMHAHVHIITGSRK